MTKKARGKNAPTKTPVDAKSTKGAIGNEKRAVDQQLIRQVLETLWLPNGINNEQQINRAQAAVELLQGIKPADEVEGMLATQMVATHSAAMECLRRAMLDGQTFEGRDQNLKHAAKLLSVYARQMEALNKHRGKGQQKVTVEHVHVEAGAQAVVGNVAAPASSPGSDNPSENVPKAIAHTPREPFEMKTRSRSPTKRRTK